MVRPLAVVFVMGLLADVVPHCGGPKVDIQGPGMECGAHGPRWRGDCRAPTECYVTEERGRVCTTSCAEDGECAALGAGFTCAGRGELDRAGESGGRRRVCERAAGP